MEVFNLIFLTLKDHLIGKLTFIEVVFWYAMSNVRSFCSHFGVLQQNKRFILAVT